MKKLTRKQLLTTCDRNVKRRKKTDRAFNEKSYRRGFYNHNFKDSSK